MVSTTYNQPNVIEGIDCQCIFRQCDAEGVASPGYLRELAISDNRSIGLRAGVKDDTCIWLCIVSMNGKVLCQDSPDNCKLSVNLYKQR